MQKVNMSVCIVGNETNDTMVFNGHQRLQPLYALGPCVEIRRLGCPSCALCFIVVVRRQDVNGIGENLDDSFQVGRGAGANGHV